MPGSVSCEVHIQAQSLRQATVQDPEVVSVTAIQHLPIAHEFDGALHNGVVPFPDPSSATGQLPVRSQAGREELSPGSLLQQSTVSPQLREISGDKHWDNQQSLGQGFTQGVHQPWLPAVGAGFQGLKPESAEQGAIQAPQTALSGPGQGYSPQRQPIGNHGAQQWPTREPAASPLELGRACFTGQAVAALPQPVAPQGHSTTSQPRKRVRPENAASVLSRGQPLPPLLELMGLPLCLELG